MKYKKHYAIEIPHQGNVRTWDCKSFEAASGDNFSHRKWESLDEVKSFFGDDEIPEELANATFPCVEVTWNGDFHKVIPAEKFDAEEEARVYIASDLNRLIVVDSDEEALELMKYRGPHESGVHRAAEEILNAELSMHVDRYGQNIIIKRIEEDILDAVVVSTPDDIHGMYDKSSGLFDDPDEAEEDYTEVIRNAILERYPYCWESNIESVVKEASRMMYYMVCDSYED